MIFYNKSCVIFEPLYYEYMIVKTGVKYFKEMTIHKVHGQRLMAFYMTFLKTKIVVNI